MIFFSVILFFSLVQTTTTITSENLIQPDIPRITQIQASHYDCSKQYNLRLFSLSPEQECTQAPSDLKPIIQEHFFV